MKSTEIKEATREVLETESIEITDEEADRLLDMEIEIEETNVAENTLTTFPLSDGKEELMVFAGYVISGDAPRIPDAAIRALCQDGALMRFIDEFANPIWIPACDIDDLFNIPLDNNQSKGYLAWHLSQPADHKYYFGEWFERKGKYSKQAETGGPRKFRTNFYRLNPEAFAVFEYLQSKRIK
jgi:hypothetical protein